MAPKPALTATVIAASAAIGAAVTGVSVQRSAPIHLANVSVATDTSHGMFRTPSAPTDDGKHRPPSSPFAHSMDYSRLKVAHPSPFVTTGANQRSVLFRPRIGGVR